MSRKDTPEFLIDIDHPCCRPDLYIARTKLCKNGQRYTFLGLFTGKPLKAGQFIGFYTGEWWDPEAYERRKDKHKLNEYALNTSADLIISPPIAKYEKRPDIKKHPMSISNEPNEKQISNAILVEYNFNVDEIDIDADEIDEERWDDDFPAAALVTCKDIKKDEEILWTYGGNPRPYRKGKSCKRPKKLEDPFKVLKSIPPCAVPIKIRTRISKEKTKKTKKT